MTRIAFLIATILVVGLAVGSQGVVAQETRTLTVTVTDPAGDPVGGVELTASWDGGTATATTVSNGQALMDVPAEGDVAIDVEHSDFVRNWPVSVGSSNDVGITVHPKAFVEVEVASGGSSVEGVFLVLRNDDRIATTGSTNEDGTLEAGVLEAGDYTIVASKAGYLSKEVEFTAAGSVTEAISIEQASVTVSFNVTDDHFDEVRPVSGATVQAASVGTITTQDNGMAALNLPVNTEYEIIVSKNGYEKLTRELTVEEEPLTRKVTLTRTPAIYIESVNQRVVVGDQTQIEVTNSYAEPVEGATVYLNGEGVGETGSNGAVKVPISDTGDQTVSATHDSLDSGEIIVEGVSSAAEGVQESTDTEEKSGGVVDMIVRIVTGIVGIFG